MQTDPTFWLLARASGLTAYALLTGSVLAGLMRVKLRPFGCAVKTASATDVHRFLALLGLGMLVLHGVALTLDKTVHMSPAALVVPGLSSYGPGSVAYGVLAAELAVLIVVSFSLRRRIGMEETGAGFTGSPTSYSSMGTVHGLKAGTDLAGIGGPILAIAAGGQVLWLTFLRILSPRSAPARGSRAAPLGST